MKVRKSDKQKLKNQTIVTPVVKDPCENVECPAHQECLASFDGASARCACKPSCPHATSPGDIVCASDGLDYPSMCHLGNLNQLFFLLKISGKLEVF